MKKVNREQLDEYFKYLCDIYESDIITVMRLYTRAKEEGYMIGMGCSDGKG